MVGKIQLAAKRALDPTRCLHPDVNRGLFMPKERVEFGAEDQWAEDKEVFRWIDSDILT